MITAKPSYVRGILNFERNLFGVVHFFVRVFVKIVAKGHFSSATFEKILDVIKRDPRRSKLTHKWPLLLSKIVE